jgi:hypothetical protein
MVRFWFFFFFPWLGIQVDNALQNQNCKKTLTISFGGHKRGRRVEHLCICWENLCLFFIPRSWKKNDRLDKKKFIGRY